MHGKWVTVAARVYYAAGLSYYLYQWFLLAGLGGTLLGIFTHAINRNYVTFAIAPVSFSLILWGVVLWSKKRTIQYLSPNPGLDEKLSDTTYTILTNNEYRFAKKVIVKARYDGVDHYINKFRWSGGSNVRAIEATSAPHRVTITHQAHDIHMICRVEFERPLRSGEELEFNYAFEMTDNEGVAEQFLAHSIYYRTDKIISRVRFDPRPVNLRFYRRQILASNTADIPIKEETISVTDHESELIWEVNHARIGYRYKMIW